MDLVSTWLQRYRSDVHLADDMGRTALYYAVLFGHRDAYRLESIELLFIGWNISLTMDNDGVSSIMVAARQGHGVDIMRLLMNAV